MLVPRYFSDLSHSSERRATARLDGLSSDIFSLIGDKERDEFRDVFGFLDATKLDVLLDTLRFGLTDRDPLLQ